MPIAYDPNYSSVNTGALRKPAPTVGAPGLVQHFAFWVPRGTTKRLWHQAIDHFLYRIYRHTYLTFQKDRDNDSFRLPASLFSCANVDDNERLWLLRHHVDLKTYQSPSISNLRESEIQARSVRYEIFSLHTVYRGIDLTIRADLRNELWGLTFIADLSRTYQGSVESPTFNRMRNALSDLFALSSRIVGSDEIEDTIAPYGGGEYDQVGETLYGQFNRFIIEDIFSRCEEELDGGLPSIGGLIADFRGVILGLAVEAKALKAKPFDLLAARTGQRRTMHSRINYAKFENQLALRVLDALWPFIRGAFPASAKFNSIGKSELTVSRFVDDGAIYVTSLGKFTADIASSINDPVRYLLIVNYPSRWQIGRLVDRINSMGVARIAALYDLVALQKANDDLRDLSNEWRIANEETRSGLGPLVDARTFAARLEALSTLSQCISPC